MADNRGYRDRSVLIHGKFRSEKWDFQDHILPPITTAVSFRLRSAERGAEGFQRFANPVVDRSTEPPIYIYGRLDEPCQGLLEETLAFAEHGECCVCYATGMAAISAAVDTHLTAGQHMLYHPAIYGCTYGHINTWLKRFGVASDSCNLNEQGALESLIRPETRVVYFETPCNPTMELIDIADVVRRVHALNKARPERDRIVTIVDNTFSSPAGQQPLGLGVDFVVHSLTKHIGGFGATMGGAVIGSCAKETDLLLYRKDFGASLSPDAAWHILTYGIPSLSVRMDAQQARAQVVAEFLESHPRVRRVSYPGLPSFPQRALAQRQMVGLDGKFAPGTMIYFELEGTDECAFQGAVSCMDYLADNSLCVTLAVSLGQIRTLIEHPASMTHAAIPREHQVEAGIHPGGVRLSLGLEDPADIIADLGSALESTGGH